MALFRCTISFFLKGGQTGPHRAKRVQRGPNGVKQGQTGANNAKQGHTVQSWINLGK